METSDFLQLTRTITIEHQRQVLEINQVVGSYIRKASRSAIRFIKMTGKLVLNPSDRHVVEAKVQWSEVARSEPMAWADS